MGIVLDPNKFFVSHPSEEILEEYAFRRLPEELEAAVEEHLLICHSCQDAVAETDGLTSDLKVAITQPTPAIGPIRSPWRNRLEALPRLAVPVCILGVLGFLMLRTQEPLAPVAVTLFSQRGIANFSAAPAGRPLQLSIEAPDLALGKEYRVEVVDAAGSQVWKGKVSDIDGNLVATMSKSLGTGVYWVRLYGADSELLREFGLSAK